MVAWYTTVIVNCGVWVNTLGFYRTHGYGVVTGAVCEKKPTVWPMLHPSLKINLFREFSVTYARNLKSCGSKFCQPSVERLSPNICLFVHWYHHNQSHDWYISTYYNKVILSTWEEPGSACLFVDVIDGCMPVQIFISKNLNGIFCVIVQNKPHLPKKKT